MSQNWSGAEIREKSTHSYPTLQLSSSKNFSGLGWCVWPVYCTGEHTLSFARDNQFKNRPRGEKLQQAVLEGFVISFDPFTAGVGPIARPRPRRPGHLRLDRKPQKLPASLHILKIMIRVEIWREPGPFTGNRPPKRHPGVEREAAVFLMYCC